MTRRPTDTDAILEQMGRLIRHLARETGGAELAMNAAQRIALVELGLDGPFRLNDLAQRMGASAATASRAVDALESLGLARRAPDPSDRRALSIELTSDGRRHFDERTARARAAFAPAADSLSPEERRTLLALLERLADALRS
jgi:DNA-binding MarR family transcriptional regulator